MSTQTQQHVIELMAPARSLESAEAAIESGANALYAGVTGLSMRPKRTEFGKDEFPELVKTAQSQGVKVYATTNIYLKEQDWEFFKKKIDEIISHGPDALIMGDIGAIRYVSENYPEVHIHASIQTSIANPEAAKFYRDLGANLVVISRSVQDRTEIARIHEEVPDLDLEVFVHGGICFMYDGNCMMSSYWKQEWDHDPLIGQDRLMGQNNTKGECQLVCKRACSLTDGEEFSMADGRLMRRPDQVGLSNIPFFIENGVRILKIEGRAMPISYIKEATKLYRAAIDMYLEDPARFGIKADWQEQISSLIEARLEYERQWHIA